MQNAQLILLYVVLVDPVGRAGGVFVEPERNHNPVLCVGFDCDCAEGLERRQLDSGGVEEVPELGGGVELVDVTGGGVVDEQPPDQVDVAVGAQQSVLRAVPWVALSLPHNLVPVVGSFLFLETDGVEIPEGAVQDLVSPVEVESASDSKYLCWKAQAAP